MVELRPIGALFTDGRFLDGLQALWKLWKNIPEPKADDPNVYMIVEYGVEFALRAGDLDEAQKWAGLAPQFAEARHDMGEVEMLLGRVAFERGQYEIAKEHFLIANAKSEGRLFEGRHKKYKEVMNSGTA